MTSAMQRMTFVMALAMVGCGGSSGGGGAPMEPDAGAPAAEPDAQPAPAPDAVAPSPDTAPPADQAVPPKDGPAPTPDAMPASKPDAAGGGACGQPGDPCGTCCPGASCVNFPSLGGSFCAADCTKGTDCQSGCCAPVQQGGSVCAPPANCGGGGGGGTVAPGTYNVTVSRAGQDLYQTTDKKFIIKTQFCFEFATYDSAVLVWGGKYAAGNRITFSSRQGCDVVDILTVQ